MGQAQINVRTRACSRTFIARTKQAALTHHVWGKELNNSMLIYVIQMYFTTFYEWYKLLHHIDSNTYKTKTKQLYPNFKEEISHVSLVTIHRKWKVKLSSRLLVWTKTITIKVPQICTTMTGYSQLFCTVVFHWKPRYVYVNMDHPWLLTILTLFTMSKSLVPFLRSIDRYKGATRLPKKVNRWY